MTARILIFASAVFYVLALVRALLLIRVLRARREVLILTGALTLMAGERAAHLLSVPVADVPFGFTVVEFLAALFLLVVVVLLPEALRALLGAGTPEERVRYLLESGDDAVLVLDADATRIVACNRHVAERVGRPREVLLGAKPLEIGPEMTQEWLDRTLEPLRTGRAPWVRAETEFRSRDASTWHVGLHVQWGTFGTREVLVVVAVDLTGRRKAEEAVRQSRERLEDAQRVARLATWEWDLGTDRIVWSDELFRMFGREPGSFEPRIQDILSSMYPEDRTRMGGLVGRARAEGEGFDSEYRVAHPDGGCRWVHVTARVESDDTGQPARILGVSQDITPLRTAEAALAQSAERYRRLFEQAPVSLWEEDLSRVLTRLDALKAEGVTDLAAHLKEHPGLALEMAELVQVLDVNPATLELFGSHDRERFLRPLTEVVRVEGDGAFRETLLALYRGQAHLSVTAREAGPDGAMRDFLVSMNLPVRREEEGIALVSMVDLTARMAAAEALRQREAELSSALDAARMGIWHWDMRTEEVFWSEEAYEVFGDAGVGFEGTVESYLTLLHPDDLETIQADIAEAVAGSGDYQTEIRLRPDADGNVRWIAGAGRVSFAGDGSPVALHGLVWDTTAVRSAEQALREMETRLAWVVDHAPVVVFALDTDGRFTLSEGKHLATMGLKPSDLVGRTLDEVQGNLPLARADVRRALAGEEVGGTVPVRGMVFDTRYRPVTDATGKITGAIGIATDITDIVHAEAEHAKVVALVEGTQEFVGLTGLDGALSYLNPAGLSLAGLSGPEDIVDAHFTDLLVDASLFDEEVLPALYERGDWRQEINLRRADTGAVVPCFGTIFLIREPTTGDPMAVAAVLRDLREEREAERERLRMERQLRQAQKMETIGTLAGGIAHDFNNLLTPILGYAHMMQEDVGTGDPAHDDLDEIVQAASRAKDLVQQILSFSRQKEQDFAVVDVAPVLREATRLLRATLPSAIEVRVRIEEGCGWVKGDPSQLHQVILNLATNALHAMKDRNGVLGLELVEVDVDQVFTLAHPTLSPGAHVRLTVSDTGHGMSAEVLERVLEPFFTTKESGEGTGLGLSVVHGIVTSHQGVLSLYSEEGVGTTVNVYLPVADRSPGVPAAGVEELAPQKARRILVVDDRPDIASLVKRMLNTLGHEAETAFGSLEALARIEAQPDHFDVMVTDYSMPEMSGLELIRKARALRPDLPVVLVSGFSDALTPERLEAEGIGAFLMKPFVARELARALQRVMGGRPRG